MIEREKKVMLTKEEYDAIITDIQIIKAIKQTNYYFDSNDFIMNTKGITCRIREKDGKFFPTVKHHHLRPYNYSSEEKLESKSYLDKHTFDFWSLDFQGEMITERKIICKDKYCEMVIDRNTYLCKTDYELEVEYEEEYERRALFLLESIANLLVSKKLLTNSASFMRRINHSSYKSSRFFERKKENAYK